MKRKADCLECGTLFETSHEGDHVFCCRGCRANFNNRRAKRGAILHDLFMAVRHQRKEAEEAKVWSAMCRLAAEWRDEDDRDRVGRKSWGDWRRLLRLNPHLKGWRSVL